MARVGTGRAARKYSTRPTPEVVNCQTDAGSVSSLQDCAEEPVLDAREEDEGPPLSTVTLC